MNNVCNNNAKDSRAMNNKSTNDDTENNTDKYFNAEIWLAIGVVVVVIATRFLPRPVNFSPVLGLMIFCGSVFSRRWLAIGIPLLGILASDFIIGTYPGMVFVYVAYFLTILMGRFVKRRKIWPVVVSSTFASVLFFILSNMGVWYFSELYEKTASGLWICFVMALPFFHNTVFSTFIGAAVLFGTYELARNFLPESSRIN